MRLHRIVILRGRLVVRVDQVRRSSDPGRHVTRVEAGFGADPDRRRFISDAAIEPDARRFRLVSRGQQARALGRGFERFGHHQCDRLLGIANPVVLQRLDAEAEHAVLLVGIERQRRPVCRRDHLDHARMCLGCGDVERGYPAARDRAHRHHGMQHTLGMVVGRKGRSTRDLEDAVAPRQRLAAGRSEANMWRR
jgi:hypothetical protein